MLMHGSRRERTIAGEGSPTGVSGCVCALTFCVGLLSTFLPGQASAGTALLTYHLQRSDIQCLVDNRERIAALAEDPIILGLGECPPAEGGMSLPVVDSFPKFAVEGGDFNRLIIIPRKLADCYFR